MTGWPLSLVSHRSELPTPLCLHRADPKRHVSSRAGALARSRRPLRFSRRFQARLFPLWRCVRRESSSKRTLLADPASSRSSSASIGDEIGVLRSTRDYVDLGCALPPASGVRRTCDLRITGRIRGEETVITYSETSHSCKSDERERRQWSGQAAMAMRHRIAKFDGGAAAAHKRRREIGVEGMSTTLSKKSTPMSYAGVEVKDYAPSEERAQVNSILLSLLLLCHRLVFRPSGWRVN